MHHPEKVPFVRFVSNGVLRLNGELYAIHAIRREAPIPWSPVEYLVVWLAIYEGQNNPIQFMGRDAHPSWAGNATCTLVSTQTVHENLQSMAYMLISGMDGWDDQDSDENEEMSEEQAREWDKYR